MPTPPVRLQPSKAWKHYPLYKLVLDALLAMPAHFRPEIHITGLNAPNLHTLSTPLGATIEEQATRTLNAMRSTWDPTKRYAAYSFVRQSQTFPDVRLVLAPGIAGLPIIMGVELKGWYVFAKEGVPTYRSQTTPAACAKADLLVVVPWALSEVISGRPIMFPPFIESARYVAEYKNYWWEHLRDAKGAKKGIISPDGAHPYPGKADKIGDVPEQDTGGNFGRIARTHLMDSYIAGIKRLPLSGVSIEEWLAFFQSVGEDSLD